MRIFSSAFADGGRYFVDFNSWQQCGLFVEVIGHGSQARRDDAANVIAFTIDNVKGNGGAEINDD